MNLPPVLIDEITGGFGLMRGKRRINTPAGHPLCVPTRALASAIAAEWDTGTKPDPARMPLTSIAVTAQDRIIPNRTDMLASIVSYVHTDLCCYVLGDHSPLSQKQNEHWEPVRARIAARYGAEPIITTELHQIMQPDALVRAITLDLQEMDDQRFVVLQIIASVTGSLFLALLLLHGDMDTDVVIAATMVDEDFYATLGGIDAHGDDPHTTATREKLRSEIESGLRYISLIAD